MDWNAAIERNREALKRVLATLVGMAGLGGGATLPRQLHRLVMRLLRPAEAAARRLVIVAARVLVVTLPPARPRKVKPRPRSIFVRNGKGTGIVLPPGVRPRDVLPGLAKPAPRSLALPLTDRLPRWDSRRRVKARGVPRIWTPGLTERAPIPRPPAPNDPIDATRLALRLAALGRALDNLPREARRFARWRARSDAAAAQIKQELDAAGVQLDPKLYGAGVRNRKSRGARRFRRLGPLRPGHPPGWRRRPTHEVHEVLNDLHYFAFLALERPDTS